MSSTKSRAPRIWVAAVLVIAVVLLSSYVYVTYDPNRPRPKIIMEKGQQSSQGPNRIYTVETTVKNNGHDGWVDVGARIYVAGRYMRQDQRINLASGENRTLQFAFDISFWGAKTDPSVSYRSWAVAD